MHARTYRFYANDFHTSVVCFRIFYLGTHKHTLTHRVQRVEFYSSSQQNKRFTRVLVNTIALKFFLQANDIAIYTRRRTLEDTAS